MPVETTSWALNGRPCLLPSSAYRPEAARANRYTCPIGPAFGRGWVLMRRSVLAAMKKKGELDKAMRLDVASGRRSLRFKRLYFVKAVNVSGGPKDSSDAAYLCELVDVRYVMAHSVPLPLYFNVVKQLGGEDYDETDLNTPADQWGPSRYVMGLPGGTWQELFDQIWSFVSGSAGFGRRGGYPSPALPWAPHGRPENYVAVMADRWKTYHELLAKFSMSLAYDPVNDRFRIVEMGAQQPGLVAAEKGLVPLYDADPIEPNVAVAPGLFTVAVKQEGLHHGLEYTELWRLPVAAVPVKEYENGVLAGPAGNASGAFERRDEVDMWGVPAFRALWDNGPVAYETNILDSEHQIGQTSRGEREASVRMTQVVDAIVLDEQTPLARRLYSGIVPTILPGERVKCVDWRQTAVEGVVTEVIQHGGLPSMGADGEWLGKAAPAENFRAPNLAGVPTTYSFAIVKASSSFYPGSQAPSILAPPGWNKSYRDSGYFLGAFVMHNGLSNAAVLRLNNPSQTGASGDDRYFRPDRLYSRTVGASPQQEGWYQGDQLCWVRFTDCPSAPVYLRPISSIGLPELDGYVGHGRLNGCHTIDGVTLPLLLAENRSVNAYGTIIPATTSQLLNVLLGGGGGVAVHASFWHVPSGIVARYSPGDKVFLSRVGCSWVVVNGPMPGICEGEPGNLVQMCEGTPGAGDLGGNEDSWEDVVVGEDGEVILDEEEPLDNFGGGVGFGEGGEEIPPP